MPEVVASPAASTTTSVVAAPPVSATPAIPAAAPVVGELATPPKAFTLRPRFVPPPPAAADLPVPVPEAVAPAKAPEVDEIAASLARLNAETRAAKADRDKVRAREAELAGKITEADQHAKAREALKSKDFVAALRALDPNLNVDEAIVTLLDQAAQLDARPLSQADVEKITVAKIEADRKAAAAKQQSENTAAIERAASTYVNACVSVFNADAFPLVAALGVSDAQIREFAELSYAKDRTVPAPAAALAHFEAQFAGKLTKAGYTRAQIAAVAAGDEPGAPAATPKAAPSAGSIVGAAASDTRGAAGEKPRLLTLPEKVALRRESIRQATQSR